MDCQAGFDSEGFTWIGAERIWMVSNLSQDFRILEQSHLDPSRIREKRSRPATLEVLYSPFEGAPDIMAWVKIVAGGYT
jgi:hypothetical protein